MKIHYLSTYTFFIILILSLSLNGCMNSKPLNYETDTLVRNRNHIIQTLDSSNRKDYCVITDNSKVPLLVPDKYIVDYDLEITTRIVRTNGYGYNNIVEKLIAYVQDIHTLEIIKEIDVKELIKPYMDNYQLVGYYLDIKEKEGQYYLVRGVWERHSEEELRKRNKESENKFKELWINIETEEVQLHDWVKEKDLSINLWMLEGTLILKEALSRDIYISNVLYLKDTSYIDIPTKNLPANNKRLYDMFPELKTANKDDGIYAHIFLTPQTNDLDALALILDDNEDLNFSALQSDSEGYYGTYGKNGELHYITKEEYEQFQKEYWEYRKKQRQE